MLVIVDLKIVPREFLGPADLSKAQAFYIHELTKIVMVGQYKDFVLTAFEIVASGLEGFNNC